MRSSPLWDVTQRRLVVTDVSGQSIGPIVKCQAVHSSWTACSLKMGLIDRPETSVSNNLRCVTSQMGDDLICIIIIKHLESTKQNVNTVNLVTHFISLPQ